ncbi:ABC transporter ATP-binding protein/permease [Flavobacteriaceae bacterium]|nr:ABC transporter ATP-binding protein/permease [Flavobacteriaceae bacterium]
MLEFLGIGLILPLINYSLKEELSSEIEYINSLSVFHIENKEELIGIFIVIISLIFIIKFIFLSYLNYKQNKFIYNLNARITSTLFRKYILMGYRKFTKMKIPDLIKNLSIETDRLSLYTSSLLTIIVEIFLSFTLVILLIVIEPLGFLFVGVFFGIVSIVFLKFTKNKILSNGFRRLEVDEFSYKHITESFGSIKEILINNKQKLVNDQFSSTRFELAKLNSIHQTLQQFPRYFLEIIAVFGIFSLLLFFYSNGYSDDKIFSLLALFGASVFKLMPSVNRMLSATNQMKYFKSSLNLIYSEYINLLEKHKNEISIGKIKSLSVRNLCFGYNDNKVLKDLNLNFEKGDIIGLRGDSGSGKSTFVNLISGLLIPDSGQIFVDDIEIDHNKTHYSNLFGYVTQEIFIFDESIIFNVTLEKDINKIDKVKLSNCLKMSGLTAVFQEQELYKNLGSNGVVISGGQKQRIGIARLLYYNPQIQIFDEATSALDSNSEAHILDSIFTNLTDRIIIIISHSDKIINKCNKKFELKDLNFVNH